MRNTRTNTVSSRTRTLTVAEWKEIDELLIVAYTHIRDLSNDALHLRISSEHKRRLESYADRAQELRERLL